MKRRLARTAGVLLLGALGAVAPASGATSASQRAVAHSAGTIHIADTAHLHLVKASGASLHEVGPVSGTLSGSMQAVLNVSASFSGEFTISTGRGTIKGHGTAIPHGSGRYESFAGSIVVTGGSGRYTHVHGRGGLFGTFDRRTFLFVIQTTGELSD